MKVGYFADGPWSHQAIELISNTDDLEIVFIVPRFDTQDPVLRSWAERLGVPFLPCKNVNSSEFLEDIVQYGADIFVSMSFNQILKKQIIELPELGFINCHAGALPFYRGRNPLNWVLINGESSFGITVHYVDEGIDTGDIIEQRLYPISSRDTYGSLLNKAIFECANVLYSAIVKIIRGDLSRCKQSDIHPVGTYFGRRGPGDEVIDFNWPAKRLFDFVRAISQPGPLARCFIGEVEYSVAECMLIDKAPAYISTVGEVVGRSPDGITVKVGDSTILITSMAEVENDVCQEAFVPKFKIGTRFNTK